MWEMKLPNIRSNIFLIKLNFSVTEEELDSILIDLKCGHLSVGMFVYSFIKVQLTIIIQSRWNFVYVYSLTKSRTLWKIRKYQTFLFDIENF